MNTEFLNTLAIISQIASSVVTVFGVLFIAWQVSDTRRFTKSQLLNDLEKDSKDYRNTYLILTNSWKPTNEVTPTEEILHEFFECLGFFERVKILIDNKVIDWPTVDRLFGYRFFLLVNNPHVQKFALYPDGDSFTTIFALHKQWFQYRQAHQQEIIHKDTDLSFYDPKQYEEFIKSYARRK